MAFVMSSFSPGGTEGQMIELVRRLDPVRWRVHVACLRADGAWMGRAAEAAAIVEFPVTSFRRPSLLRQMRAFGRWCIERRIALVHTTDLPSNLFGLPVAAAAGVPVRIANRREINPSRTPTALALQRAAYGFAHRVITNCLAAADRLKAERLPTSKIAVVANGVRLPMSDRPKRDAVRRIIAVGNLRPEKGHEVLLDAAALVTRRFPDATFELVGTGPRLPALRARAAALNISHAVEFSGHCNDVPARLAAADLFVLPSLSEAFPNALLEAIAAGLPTISSAVGGVLELVRPGRTGVLVPPGDPAALADAVGRIIGDPERAAQMGALGRSEIGERYSFERMVGAFQAIYVSELGRVGIVRAGQPQLLAS
jgi:glycosyltransferase involved in cell wall biosynthesis